MAANRRAKAFFSQGKQISGALKDFYEKNHGTNRRLEEKRRNILSPIMVCLMVLLLLSMRQSTSLFSSSQSLRQSPEQKQSGGGGIIYKPARTEQYIYEHANGTLGYNLDFPQTCKIWKDPNVTNPKIHSDLVAYGNDVDAHKEALENFQHIPDLLESIKKADNYESKKDICKTARPHPEGLKALFPSNQLSSLLSSDSAAASQYIEPILPPMRSHHFCQKRHPSLMLLDYLVHDFEAMCLKLKPTSKRILIDMGASLNFHRSGAQPIVELMQLYEKFGFNFDHIYAFERDQKDPNNVLGKQLPEKYLPSYHWMNVGVSAEEGHRFNPLHSIVKAFDEDDLIVVKLDIDTPHIELPLAKELLEDKDGVYGKLVDQFYFEYHVRMGDMAGYWGRKNVKDSVMDSIELFRGLREKGIPAHFWP